MLCSNCTRALPNAPGSGSASSDSPTGSGSGLSTPGLTDSYIDAVPADIVLLVGIFGNIHPPAIKALIDTVPQLSRPGALVLWTRGRSVPGGGGRTSEVSGWVREAGCTELSITAPADAQFVVGAAEFRGVPEPLRTGRRLFTFFR